MMKKLFGNKKKDKITPINPIQDGITIVETPKKIQKPPSWFSKFLSTLSSYSVYLDPPTPKWMKKLRRGSVVFKLQRFKDSKPWSVLMITTTFYAIVADDVNVLAFPKTADPFIYWMYFVSLILFVFEISLTILLQEGYFPGFFFFLDILAVASLIPYQPFVRNDLNLQYAKAGSIVRLTRIGRIVRVIRGARVAEAGGRIGRRRAMGGMRNKKDEDLPLDDVYSGSPNRGNSNSTNLMNVGTGGMSTRKPEGSNVGRKLTSLTTRKVILGVLLMVVVVSLLDSTEVDDVTSRDVSLQQLYVVYNYTVIADGQSENNPLLIQSINTFKGLYANTETPLYQLTIANRIYVPDTNNVASKLRVDANLCYTCESADACFDSRAELAKEAYINLILTTFILLVLIVWTMTFSKDFHTIVIAPIERMSSRLAIMAQNPLIQLDDIQYSRRKQRRKNTNLVKKVGNVSVDVDNKDEQDLEFMDETVLIENALAKFAGLLQVGFGEAGAQIISRSISAGTLNAVVPGKKVHSAIYGFCDIRNFTECTECLQEDVMLFVNRVAEIVHRQVHFSGGSANKNIGDAFLLVWKMNNESEHPFLEGGSNPNGNLHPLMSSLRLLSTPPNSQQMLNKNQLADKALAAFIRTIEEMARSAELKEMTSTPSLQARLPGYEVKMGFGLHVGWSIEGAIGSKYKIDASYLSPHVNIAARLEGATKQYGVPLLMSEQFYSLLSHNYKPGCRKLDRVTVRGSQQPMYLYTYETSLGSGPAGSTTLNISTAQDITLPTHSRMERERSLTKSTISATLHVQDSHPLVEELPATINKPDHTNIDINTHNSDNDIDNTNYNDNNNNNSTHILITSPSFKITSPMIIPSEKRKQALNILEYIKSFESGVDQYLAGNWSNSRTIFEQCLDSRPDDMPTRVLLEYMSHFDFLVPDNWRGYRELTEK